MSGADTFDAAAGRPGRRAGELPVRASYSDFDDLWAPFPTGLAPSGAFCKSLDRRGAPRYARPTSAAWRWGLPVRELAARAWAVAGTRA